MKRFLSYVSFVLLGIFVMSCFESEAFCKKKKRKKTNTTVTTQDSMKVVRAPGVRNQKQLDSIKKSRVKEIK